MATTERGELLWTPTDETIRNATLTRFATAYGHDDYESLWRWSVEDLEGFWAAVWEFFAVRRSYADVLTDRSMPGAKWFPGAHLNYAEYVFRDFDPSATAIRARSETRGTETMTWAELERNVSRARAGLAELGVGRGDRVVAYMPNIPETVVAFLATASLGATWSSAAPEFGARSVIDRFAQIEPKVLLAVDGYRYGGKDFDKIETVNQLRAAIPTLEQTVVLPYLSGADEFENALTWDQLLAFNWNLEFEMVPFDHPLWVLYSSGTTGLPKAIVQGQGGILLEHLKKMHLHCDLQPGDRFFWFTTTGWMMWNFLIAGLLAKAEILLYDGNPGYPDMNALWDFARDSEMTCFGTSASYIAACMKAGISPRQTHDLDSLRSVGSTGSPLSPEGFDWVYREVKSDVWLFSTSGGTDICTAFVGGVPTLPVTRGELQARALGAKVEAFDEEGRPVVDQVGELVITEPMPSMPLFFWNDPDGERYRSSYFDAYPGIWRHGDWIEITSRGTAVIYGRSDSTINRQGVRMGTSEIYRAVLALDEVLDALVIDVPRPGTEGWMPLFVVLAEGVPLDDELIARIKKRVREDCSPRHVPDEVYEIAEVPRTLSGKVLEIPVKKILMGTEPDQAASRESLANPEALDWFIDFADRLAKA